METKHYLSKKLTYSLFGSKYYHYVKSKKILLDYLIGRDYENIYNVLSRILSDNDTVIDVGANMGQYLTRISKFVTKGKIICIEPLHENVKALKYLKKFLSISNAEIIEKAIGDSESNRIITIPKLKGVPITTQASLITEKLPIGIDYESREVKTTTLDHIVESLKLNNVNFIKSDTEGFDSHVLRSGMMTVKKFKPILQVEESCFRPEMDWLFDIGYKAIKISNNKIVAIHSTDDEQQHKCETYLIPQNLLEHIQKKLMQ